MAYCPPPTMATLLMLRDTVRYNVHLFKTFKTLNKYRESSRIRFHYLLPRCVIKIVIMYTSVRVNSTINKPE